MPARLGVRRDKEMVADVQLTTLCYQYCPCVLLALAMTAGFRTGCHGLPKDIGSQTGVPRRQSLCQLCGADYGDEMHLV